MFTVNKKPVVYSTRDGAEVLKGKISLVLKTLPSLFVLPPTPIQDGSDYTITPMIFVENGQLRLGQPQVPFSDQLELIKDEPNQLEVDFLKKLYIISKIQSTINDFEMQPDMGKNFALFELETEFGSVDETVWYNRLFDVQKFQQMVEENAAEVTLESRTTDLWAGVTPSFTPTAFVTNKINLETEIPNLRQESELMVFDTIRVNATVVACFYQDLIKYNQDFNPWIKDYLAQDKLLTKKLRASDIIRLMIAGTTPRKKYKMINVYVYPETISFTVEMLLNFDSTNGADNLKKLIKTIIVDMGKEDAYDQRVEKEYYYGSYSAPINVPIFVVKDLLTNDSNVYNIAYINESALINTRRSNLNLFLKNSSKDLKQHVGVSLFERPDTVGTFVRLKKIRGGAELQTTIDTSMGVVNKLLQYSVGKVAQVFNYYQTYINIVANLDPTVDLNREKENLLKVQAPEIFLPNYTRLCNKPPVIIEGEPQPEDGTILKFPIYGEAEPRYYKCPYPNYPHPGLRRNTTLGNRDTFPYVPCCYQRPQSMNKNYNTYYNQAVYEQRINSGEIGKTLKILAPKRIGELPPRINKLLSYSTKLKFYRYGFKTSLYSVLDVLNTATGSAATIEAVRRELSTRVELCKGEISSLQTGEIAEKIMDPATYVNPRLFKRALEDYYNLSIILFSKDQDDFSVYANKFLKFICPLRKRVVFMIEHEQAQHVELVLDEETLGHVNKQGSRPILTWDRNDFPVKKLFALYKDRFTHTLYDIGAKRFVSIHNLLMESSLTGTALEGLKRNTFHVYPWETISPNGKIVKSVQPLNQYTDSYGQTRLVEFRWKELRFVSEFQPLPCLAIAQVPEADPNHYTKPLEYFIQVNDKLTEEERATIREAFAWCNLYRTPLVSDADYRSPYYEFRRVKKLAQYILWAACHAYAQTYQTRPLSVMEWIDQDTRVDPNFSYSRVTISPLFNLDQFTVDSKFIFNSVQLQERVMFNLRLISTVNLKVYAANVYHAFYQDVTNFTVPYPAQLALSKTEYYQRTREPLIVQVLSDENVPYLRAGTLYVLENLFGIYSGNLCLFELSLEKLFEKSEQLFQQAVPPNTRVNIVLFNQGVPEYYVLGQNAPELDVIILNINNLWFYGLLRPKLTDM
ncbi:hypothetical protein MIV016R [Invertebrate iridescent virus 3]|uniref:Uncharacterized protein 016R n=1 Tax=Invertebrate iridescent virus 3 TaxID=345201 RepID=VF295_IIV3|nr:hypothetical protein MIV016R [Invertebrate iridescent virus 3]Q197E4.1 RecName: Full=Uncharacterized protein 016R [Invertebrate iridescent virus 3]ABF82046.1 hypothetical protein MIV016R [Invertebrate iridescent virus 3]